MQLAGVYNLLYKIRILEPFLQKNAITATKNQNQNKTTPPTELHATTQNNSKVSKHKEKRNCRTLKYTMMQFTVDKATIWHKRNTHTQKFLTGNQGDAQG